MKDEHKNSTHGLAAFLIFLPPSPPFSLLIQIYTLLALAFMSRRALLTYAVTTLPRIDKNLTKINMLAVMDVLSVA
jgi:hypothetical protein